MKPITKLVLLSFITLYETATFAFGHRKYPESQVFVFAKAGADERSKAPKNIVSFIVSTINSNTFYLRRNKLEVLIHTFIQDRHQECLSVFARNNADAITVLKFRGWCREDLH